MEPKKPLYVTQPNMPALADFIPYLEQIWESRWLTNAGPFHQQLERRLADYLGVRHLALFTNATIALVTALQALRVTGEVITTPFSFVATAHSLLWNSIEPVFVDIRANDYNMDPDAIEAAITPRTTAIMPVHCYGNACEVERIRQIADRYGLRVIYDAAHAFGIRRDGQSLLNHGDMSVLSFHATKVYTTFEGGAIVCPDAKTKQRIDYLKNFGFADEVTVVAPGINGKMNEVQAAFGLLQLDYVSAAIERRLQIDRQYRASLDCIAGIELPIELAEEARNGSYFPIRVTQDFPVTRDGLYDRLRVEGIFARRYFYPLISDMPMYRGLPSADPQRLPNARAAAAQVLCLPIYPDLHSDDIERVVSLIRAVTL